MLKFLEEDIKKVTDRLGVLTLKKPHLSGFNSSLQIFEWVSYRWVSESILLLPGNNILRIIVGSYQRK